MTVPVGQEIGNGSKATKPTTISLDLSVATNGDCTGVLTVQPAGEVTLLRFNGQVWMKAGESSLVKMGLPAERARQAAGYYAPIADGQRLGRLATTYCGLPQTVVGLLNVGSLTPDPVRTLQSRPVQPIADTSGGTIYLGPVDGRPQVLHYAMSVGTNGLDITTSSKQLTLAPPNPGQVTQLDFLPDAPPS